MYNQVATLRSIAEITARTNIHILLQNKAIKKRVLKRGRKKKKIKMRNEEVWDRLNYATDKSRVLERHQKQQNASQNRTNALIFFTAVHFWVGERLCVRSHSLKTSACTCCPFFFSFYIHSLCLLREHNTKNISLVRTKNIYYWITFSLCISLWKSE